MSSSWFSRTKNTRDKNLIDNIKNIADYETNKNNNWLSEQKRDSQADIAFKSLDRIVDLLEIYTDDTTQLQHFIEQFEKFGNKTFRSKNITNRYLTTILYRVFKLAIRQEPPFVEVAKFTMQYLAWPYLADAVRKHDVLTITKFLEYNPALIKSVPQIINVAIPYSLKQTSLEKIKKVIEVLIQYGADINNNNRTSIPPLMDAISKYSGNNSMDLIKYLVEECDADITVKSIFTGKTALDYATAKKLWDVKKYLEAQLVANNIDLDDVNLNLETPAEVKAAIRKINSRLKAIETQFPVIDGRLGKLEHKPVHRNPMINAARPQGSAVAYVTRYTPKLPDPVRTNDTTPAPRYPGDATVNPSSILSAKYASKKLSLRNVYPPSQHDNDSSRTQSTKSQEGGKRMRRTRKILF